MRHLTTVTNRNFKLLIILKVRYTIKLAFKNTNGIVEHEFSDEVIKASEKRVNEMIERIATGQSTFEEEDDRLMAEWERNNQEDK